MKKIWIAMLLMAPVALLAAEPARSMQETQEAPATGSGAAKSHHARHRQKRSKHSHHRAQKHHASKEHSQPQ